MQILEEIRNWKGKPKDLLEYLAENVKKDKKLAGQLIEGLKTGKPTEKGTCIEVMEYVTQENPEIALVYIEAIVEHINDDAPRVKWETARVIANVSRKYPDKTVKAIPKLLTNTKDKGTVVRWSAAYALGEIAKNNQKIRQELVPKIETIAKKEQNTGVKNVYLKVLKIVGK